MVVITDQYIFLSYRKCHRSAAFGHLVFVKYLCVMSVIEVLVAEAENRFHVRNDTVFVQDSSLLYIW